MNVRKKMLKTGAAIVTVASLLVGMFSTTDLFAQDVDTEKKTEETAENTNVSAKSLNVDVDFFDYNIPGEEKVAINDYAIKAASGAGIAKEQVFLFGGDRTANETGKHNVWTGYERSQYGGIVEDKLAENGSLQFNNKNGIYGVNLFPEEGDHSLDQVIKPYYNANFQFLDENGTYVFDSDRFAATGLRKDDKGNTVLDMDFTKKGPYFENKPVGTLRNKYGFFPFNTVDGEDHKAEQDRHCMFGMKMELNFYMPKDGLVPTKSNPDDKKPMVFEFSGDDDVWIFVDGKLALDLGGIHDKVGGSINFATGKVIYEKPNMSGKGCQVKNIYEDCGISNKAFSEHTLTMFYLERGEYDSNCKITFNIPTVLKTDDIAIKKQVQGVVPADQKDREYRFKLKYGTQENKLDNTYIGEYKVHNEQNQDVETKTATGGVIRLKAGETAEISKDFTGADEYYKVEELFDDNHYTTDWLATGQDNGENKNGSGTETDVLKRSKETSSGGTVVFTNTYHSNNSLTIRKKVDKEKTPEYKGEKFAFVVSKGGIVEKFELADGEEKTFTDIPAGTEYTVAEFITGAGIVATGNSIYGKPDVTINEEKTEVSLADEYYSVSGKIGSKKTEDEETVVEYTNRRIEATPTPAVTSDPAVTGTPEPTKKPTEEPTSVPTETPVVVVTKTPAAKPTPSTVPTKTQSPTNTPVQETEKPQKTDVPGTKEPSKTETPVTEKPEITKVPDTQAPEETKKPEPTPVLITEPPLVPDAPVEITPEPVDLEATVTPAPTSTTSMEMTPPDVPGSEPDQASEPEQTSKPDKTDSGKKDSNKKAGVTTVEEEDIPDTLPRTGAMGTFMANRGIGFYILLSGAIIVSIGALGYGLFRKKNNEKENV